MTQTDQQNVPKLRFPGFDGAWDTKRLGETSHLTSSKRVYLSDYVEHGVPFFRGKEISELEKGVVPDDVLYISREAFDRFRDKFGAPASGDILITAVGTLANVFRVRKDQEFYFKDGNLVWLRAVKENSEFLEHLLRFNRPLVLRSAIGSSQKALTIVELSKLRLSFPTLPEQRKIASFLGAVDTRIAQLDEKRNLLEDYKKGCMQQLFSRKIRFKDDTGNGFPDWEEKRLGEVFSWINTNSLSRERLTEEGGQVQNIHYGDIHKKFSTNFRQQAEHVPYVKNAVSSDFKPEQFCKVGDVVIADASEDYADIGKAIEIVSLSETPMVAGLHTYIARPKPETIQSGFGGYLLRSKPMRRQIERIAQGISVLGISKRNLEKLTFLLPHPDEQRKISDFLSALDRKIDLVGQELNCARSFKKGLLQQMFV